MNVDYVGPTASGFTGRLTAVERRMLLAGRRIFNRASTLERAPTRVVCSEAFADVFLRAFRWRWYGSLGWMFKGAQVMSDDSAYFFRVLR